MTIKEAATFGDLIEELRTLTAAIIWAEIHRQGTSDSPWDSATTMYHRLRELVNR